MSGENERNISHDDARKVAQRLINGSFRRDGEQLEYDRRPKFSIPARPDYDDDLVISSYIEQQKNHDAQYEAMRKALEEAKAALKQSRRVVSGATQFRIPVSMQEAEKILLIIDRAKETIAALSTPAPVEAPSRDELEKAGTYLADCAGDIHPTAPSEESVARLHAAIDAWFAALKSQTTGRSKS